MPDYLNFFLILILGLFLGGLFCLPWILRRSKVSVADSLELASLRERSEALQKQVDELRSSLASKEEALMRLQRDLAEESGRRLVAERECERLAALETEYQALQQEHLQGAAVRARLETELQSERTAAQEKLQLLQEARQQLSEAFQALSAEALQRNNESFLQLAGTVLQKQQEAAKGELELRQQAISQLVRPLAESLQKVDGKIVELEKERAGAYAGLSEQVKQLLSAQVQLQAETANLVKALRAPQVRGRWGEIQLKRVVELAGMLEHCDFTEQESVSTPDGRFRPDLLVHLPNDRKIIVDAKCPLQAYLDALAAPDEATRVACLQKHAEQVQTHLTLLARKNYQEQFTATPEFVVLFLPGETFFSAALEQRPGLIEIGAESKVILATPTTLIALLKAVAYGWRQEKLAQNALAISQQGKMVYEGVRFFSEHFLKIGDTLGTLVSHYNKAVGSLERRFLPAARRLNELHCGSDKKIPELNMVETTVSPTVKEELAPGSTPDSDEELLSANANPEDAKAD